jgi:hypothetical protein
MEEILLQIQKAICKQRPRCLLIFRKIFIEDLAGRDQALHACPPRTITVESAKKYKSHKKRVCFNLIKSNNANNGLPLFVHILQDLYRRSCRTGLSCSRACPGSASPFFVLCFLLVKFINLLDMDGLSVVTLTALSTVMPQEPGLIFCLAFCICNGIGAPTAFQLTEYI